MSKEHQQYKIHHNKTVCDLKGRGPFLLSHMESQWLRLIALLGENKAVPVRCYVASVFREIEGGEVEAEYEETGGGSERTVSEDNTGTEQ